MVHVTGNFQNESPLSERVSEALAEALAQGWSDPRKLSRSGARARILQDQCIQSLAHALGVLPQEIELIGEPNLALSWGAAGLLTPTAQFFYSSVDRKEIHALARQHATSHEMPVSRLGAIVMPSIPPGSVVSLQAANGETGVVQALDLLVDSASDSQIACDFSSAGTLVPLPHRWNTAFFDPKSWQGPQGLGILAISESAIWRNPQPHLGARRTPGSFSIPLLVASAIALEEWVHNQAEESARLRNLTGSFRKLISQEIANVDIAGDFGDERTCLPHITSLSFLYVEGEELLRRLEKRGMSVDSGSACTAEDLAPSHVLAAMGALTHGNVRITFHRGATTQEMLALVQALVDCVSELRRN